MSDGTQPRPWWAGQGGEGPQQSWAWPLPPAPGAGRHSESRDASGPSRTSSLSHSIGPGGPGGAARLEASPGEAGPSQQDEVQLRGGLGRPPASAAAPNSGSPDWQGGARCVGSAGRQGSPAGGAGTRWPGWRTCPEATVGATSALWPRPPRVLWPEFASAARLLGQEGGRAKSPSSQNTGKKII